MSHALRPYLEQQSDRVEAILAAHRAPGHITGGTVGPFVIRFFITPAPHTRLAAIQSLTADLTQALQVPALTIRRGQEGVILEFPNPQPRRVGLLDLWYELQPLPQGVAILGLQETGVPLLARWAAPDGAPILITGDTGSGKTVLLRTLAASLMLSNAPAQLTILAIDPQGRMLGDLAAPHLLRGHVITDLAEAHEALSSLGRLLAPRARRRENAPRLVVLVNELAAVVTNDRIAVSLAQVAQQGQAVGIHLCVATQRPDAPGLSGVLGANFPLRLVGRTAAVDVARSVAGPGGTNAHALTGRGDFLAVTGADVHRFQAAFIGPAALQAQVAQGAARLILPAVAAQPNPVASQYASLYAG